MNKHNYKFAYVYIYNLLNCDDESMKWPLTIESMETLKEACDKAKKYDELTKIPTLEKVKKEWKDLGYEWIEELYTDSIVLKKTVEEPLLKNDTHIVTYFISINIIDKTYRAEKRSCFACEGKVLTLQEHQLITKTIQALGESNGN